MNTSQILTIVHIMLFSFVGSGQDTTKLSYLDAKNNNIVFNSIYEVINPGADLTFLTKNYSSDSTRFYLNKQLYSGIGLISDSNQLTIIGFNNGRLHGIWQDITYRNGNNTEIGTYKNGVKDGVWSSGHYNDSGKLVLYSIQTFEMGELNGVTKYYGYYHDLIAKNGYQEIQYSNGRIASTARFYNLDGSFMNGKEIDNNKFDYRFIDPITEIITYKEGYLVKQEKWFNDTVFQINEYSQSHNSYDIVQTNFHRNGEIKSKGTYYDYTHQTDEWLFYDDTGMLTKKEYWVWGFRADLSRKTKTILYNKDGSIDKTINH